MFVENYIFKMLLCWTLAQFNLILKQFKMLLFWTLAQWALCNVHWFPWFLRTNSSMSWKVTSETFKEVVAQSTKANLNYILFVSSRKSLTPTPSPPSLPGPQLMATALDIAHATTFKMPFMQFLNGLWTALKCFYISIFWMDAQLDAHAYVLWCSLFLRLFFVIDIWVQ